MSEEQKEVSIKRILVPLDGSSCSIRAAKCAIEVARFQKAQILCIHVIASLPYGYGAAVGSAIEQYFEVVKNQAQSWFNKVIEMAKNEGINDVKQIFSCMLSQLLMLS